MIKTAIAIPCFKREETLAKCLASISENAEIKNGDVDVLSYHDFEGKERLHGCRNILRSIRETFKCGFNRVIRMDSDLQVSPYFVRQVIALKEWSGIPSQSHIVCASNKTVHARDAVHGCHTGTNLVIDRQEWDKISPMVDEYEQSFLLPEPKHRSHREPKQWFKAHVNMIPSNIWFRNAYVSGEAGIGADSLIWFSLLANGMNVACLFVNRAIHISTHGENYEPEAYRRMSAATLDVIESDSTQTDFRWMD